MAWIKNLTSQKFYDRLRFVTLKGGRFIMDFLFIIEEHEAHCNVIGHKKEEGKVFFYPMNKKDWREKTPLGMFYKKSGKMKFTNVKRESLINYLTNKFGSCEFAIQEGI